MLATGVWDNPPSYSLFVCSSKKHRSYQHVFFFPFHSSGVNCQVVVAPCSPDPCENSGICQESPDSEGYTCQCAPGWEGNVEGEYTVLSMLSSSTGIDPFHHCLMRGLNSGLSTFQGRDALWILMNVSPSPAKIMPCAIIFKAATCVNVNQASLEETVTVTSMTASQVSISSLLCVSQLFLEIILLCCWSLLFVRYGKFFYNPVPKRKSKTKPQAL